MKLRKRCLAALLVLTMLLTLIPFGSVIAEEAEVQTVLSDIDANTTVGKAVGELSKLNIINGYEDGTFRPDNTITRGEIAKIVITFMNQQDAAFDTIPSGFADVDSVNHWAKKYIKLAADQKIVNGYPDGTFLADNPVKYTEIVKMLVCMLGYGSIAESRTIPGGAWYSGYMAIAAEKGILNNASVNNVEDNASRATVAILTYNCLTVEIAKTDASGNTVINSGSSALEDFQKKEKITGIVTGVQQTGIETGDTGLTRRQITVDVKGEETIYQVPSDYDTMSILGRKISAYVEEGDADGDRITQITTEKTESVVVDAADIESVDNSGLEYDGNENVFFDDLKVIYNGKYDPTFKVKEFEDIFSGSIEFVCNDGDGDAEVAFVSAYETFVVNSTDKNAEPPKVYGKYNTDKELTIPYESKNVFFSLTKTGSTSEAETIVKSLSEWDVISVMRSKAEADGRGVWHGIVTSKRVSGKIKSTEGANLKQINGTMYELSPTYKAYKGSKPNMETNDYVTVYLDHEGKIAAASASTTETKIDLGFMITAAKQGVVDGTAQVKLYSITSNSSSPVITRDLASVVTIDGKSYNDADKALDALKIAATAANEKKKAAGIHATDYSQLIRYSMNESNKIEMIDTVIENESRSEDDLEVGIAFPEDNTNENKTLKYTGNGRFEASSLSFIVDSSTKVLEIPYNDVTNTEKYAVRSYSSAFSTGSSYQVEAYNVSVGKAKYVISYVGLVFGTLPINETSPLMIATNITSGLDSAEEIETVDKAWGYSFPNGTKIPDDQPLETKAEGLLMNKYAWGDIFRYAVSGSKITEAEKILDFGTSRPTIYNVMKDNLEITKPIETENVTEAVKEAKALRRFRLDDKKEDGTQKRSDIDTLGGFMFGTILDFDNSSFTFTPTIKEDACGIQPTEKEILNFGSAKLYLYDYRSGVKEENKVVVDTVKDQIKAYEKLLIDNENKENKEIVAAENASQVLVYYTGNYSIKAIIIFKY